MPSRYTVRGKLHVLETVSLLQGKGEDYLLRRVQLYHRNEESVKTEEEEEERREREREDINYPPS